MSTNMATFRGSSEAGMGPFCGLSDTQNVFNRGEWSFLERALHCPWQMSNQAP